MEIHSQLITCSVGLYICDCVQSSAAAAWLLHPGGGTRTSEGDAAPVVAGLRCSVTGLPYEGLGVLGGGQGLPLLRVCFSHIVLLHTRALKISH